MTTNIQRYNLEPGYSGECQVCQSTDLQPVIDLGYSAPCDSLLRREDLRKPETAYPLSLFRCRACGLPQIDYVVEPEVLFHKNYPYRSGITESLRKFLHSLSDRMVPALGLKKGDLIIDIGSNDGTLLEGFKNHEMRVLGVEPTDIAHIAREAGVETIQKFFTLRVAEEINEAHGEASLVAAANVFAHINHVGDLMAGVKRVLKDGGYFVTESHYMLDILKTLQYDSIYHEHLRFYLMKPLIELFDSFGFTVVDVERIPNYGGSIRVTAQLGNGHEVASSVGELIAEEEAYNCYSDATYDEFAKNIRRSRSEIRSTLVKIQEEGKTVAGVGCPGRCVTLLTYAGITNDLLPYIAEQSTSLKLGLFTPMTHLPVIDEEILFRDPPDYVLILSWHYADAIMRNLKKKGLRSDVIVPLPEVRIVRHEDIPN
jgi:SAM-dependent methyltransferase